MNRLAILLPMAIAGCGVIGSLQGPADDLASWQAVPLPLDASLDQLAASAGPCRIDVPDGVPIDVILQDRRTASTAAFLVRGPETAGSCMYSARGGGSGGGSQPAHQLRPLEQALSVDEDGSGGLGDGIASLLGGRVQAGVSSVRVEVGEMPAVQASVGNGHWLAWWPNDERPTQVIALDAAGRELVVLAFGPNGWTPS